MTEPNEVFKPRMAQWKLKEGEQQLFDARLSVPNFRLADKARRLLIDMNYEMSKRWPDSEVATADELDPLTARRMAVVSCAAVGVRACGSVMALVACGYVPEAAGAMRRLLEARFRGQDVLSDKSKQRAISWLMGRPKGTLASLAHRYGDEEELRILHVFAHADVRGLTPLHMRPTTTRGEVVEGVIDLRPDRDDTALEPRYALYATAYEAVGMRALLAETFELAVQIPPSVSKELLPAVGLQPQDNKVYNTTYPWLGFRVGVLGNLSVSKKAN